MILSALLGGCGASERPPPLPDAATAHGVEIVGEGWSAAAASLRLAGGVAEAAEPAVVTASDGPPLEIVADRSEWDLRGRTARFEGNVRVRRASLLLVCAELEVTYADARSLERVVASGEVRVQQGERTGSAARAELAAATGQIVLTGEPRLAEGPNALAGDRIVLWLDDDRALCEGAAGAPCRLLIDGAALP